MTFNILPEGCFALPTSIGESDLTLEQIGALVLFSAAIKAQEFGQTESEAWRRRFSDSHFCLLTKQLKDDGVIEVELKNNTLSVKINL